MKALWRILRAGLGAELDLWRGHARRRMGLLIAAAAFAALALGLAIALGIYALALWLGPAGALAVALAVSILICLILLIALKLEARGHARRVALRAAERRRTIDAAILSLLPSLRGSTPALFVGLAVLALTLLTGPSRKDDDDDA
ncbi:hypothetical protein [Solirhodobacter olei]|uniref:hypothetical protein n=1 Tax=Solirhodobacter olei TaxID=2493082 RepID=UPI000FDA06F1|nr:hypothetical protein [Solirhodobacter olei]